MDRESLLSINMEHANMGMGMRMGSVVTHTTIYVISRRKKQLKPYTS